MLDLCLSQRDQSGDDEKVRSARVLRVESDVRVLLGQAGTSQLFLESMIQTRGEPLDGRLMTHLLSNTNLMSDGGQWDMLANLITKYGLVRVVFY